MRFITVTDREFFVGTCVLLYSVAKNSGIRNPQFAVLHDGLTPEQIMYLSRVSPYVDCISIQRLPEFSVPENKLSAEKRARLKKLYMFSFENDENLCYLDSDMICLGSLGEVEQFSHFSAAPDVGYSSAECVRGFPMFNSGMMVFKSHSRIYKELQQFARSDHFESKADQWLLNDFMYSTRPGEVHIVHSIFNTVVSLKVSNPRAFNELTSIGIRLLHFTSPKPWAHMRLSINGSYVRSAVKSVVSRQEYALWHNMKRELVRTFGVVPE